MRSGRRTPFKVAVEDMTRADHIFSVLMGDAVDLCQTSSRRMPSTFEAWTSRNAMRGSRITGMGHYLPDRVVTNDDLAQIIDTSSEWIIQRTGIEERRWVEGDVGAADLAFEAPEGCTGRAGIAASDLDMIVFATLSPDLNFPGSSCTSCRSAWASGIATLDIRNQCTRLCLRSVHRGPVHQDGHDEPRARGGRGDHHEQVST